MQDCHLCTVLLEVSLESLGAHLSILFVGFIEVVGSSDSIMYD